MVSLDPADPIEVSYQDGAVMKLGGHQPAGPFRGGKYSSLAKEHPEKVKELAAKLAAMRG